MIAPGYPKEDPHTEPSGAGATASRPCDILLSFVGSTGLLGSTYSSRFPLPLVSRMSGVQPCEASSSPVSSSFLVSSHPTTGPPPLVQGVLFSSSANIRWCVLKPVLMWVYALVSGSYTPKWRLDLSSGKSLAEGWSDPSLKTSGLSGGRTAAVIQTRPWPSNIGL